MMLKVLWGRLPCIFSLAALALVLMPACHGNADSSDKAADFALLNLKGETVRLSDYKGKVVLVNFFATYCPPCRLEVPDLVRLQKRHGGRGFEILGISVDQNPEQVLPVFARTLAIDYPLLLATSRVIKDYGNVYAIPVSFLISRDQKILKRYTGMVSEGDIEPDIVRALE